MSEKDILPFLKLIADKTRLNIVGLLAEQPRSGDELAALLNVNPSTISQHISRMKKLGLIQVRAEQYYNIYAIDFDCFNWYTSQLTAVGLSTRVLNSQAINFEAYEQQILHKWIKDSSLQGVPSQIQHRPILIGWLTNKFDRDRKYAKEQVKDVLAAYCSPKFQTTWHRILLKEGKLSRLDNREWYWRTDSVMASQLNFNPMHMPQAELVESIRAPRIRNGRLTVSRDPELLRRNLLSIALRIQMERLYSPKEIDQITTQYSEGDPDFFRQALVDKQVLYLQDDGFYQRDPLGPEHQIWGSAS
ncbi:MAG: DUF2087 domain-containing protein [Chloroflexota bacterium]